MLFPSAFHSLLRHDPIGQDRFLFQQELGAFNLGGVSFLGAFFFVFYLFSALSVSEGMKLQQRKVQQKDCRERAVGPRAGCPSPL